MVYNWSALRCNDFSEQLFIYAHVHHPKGQIRLITMYTTKPLSLFKSHPEVAAESPPEGGNAGYLVMKAATDDEDDEITCWGTSRRVLELPFPQNRVLRVEYGVGDNSTYQENVVFVPIPDQPLASNRYYIVVAMASTRGS